MRTSFVLSEIGVGLRRNVTMTISAVLTVGLSLAVLGVGLLFSAQAAQTRAFWYDQIEMSVFLSPDVTSAERDAVQVTLDATPQVESVVYESKQQAFERFQQQFQDSPDLIRNVTPDALPESFRVKLLNPQDFDAVEQAVATQPGVDNVLDVDKLLGPFFDIVNKVQLYAWLVAGVLVVVALLLIYNTIRVAAFSRRRETGIMRLVGSSNFYIRLPFVLEGAIAGLVGAAFACGLLAAFYYFFVQQTLRPVLSSLTTFVGWGSVGLVALGLVLFGVVLSALASLLTLQRHLKV